jgi:hypothetical protein
MSHVDALNLMQRAENVVLKDIFTENNYIALFHSF